MSLQSFFIANTIFKAEKKLYVMSFVIMEVNHRLPSASSHAAPLIQSQSEPFFLWAGGGNVIETSAAICVIGMDSGQTQMPITDQYAESWSSSSKACRLGRLTKGGILSSRPVLFSRF